MERWRWIILVFLTESQIFFHRFSRSGGGGDYFGYFETSPETLHIQSTVLMSDRISRQGYDLEIFHFQKATLAIFKKHEQIKIVFLSVLKQNTFCILHSHKNASDLKKKQHTFVAIKKQQLCRIHIQYTVFLLWSPDFRVLKKIIFKKQRFM